MHDATNQIELIELDDALLETHMRQRLGTLAISGLSLIIAYLLLMGSLKGELLNLWLCAGVVVILCRAVFSVLMGTSRRARSYLKVQYCLVGLTGIVWGSLSLFWSAELALSDQLIIFMFPLALTIGAVSANGSWLPTFYCFAIPAQLPSIVVLLTSGSQGMIKIALPASVFLVAQVLLAKAYNSQLRKSIELKLINERMAENLAKHNTQLLEANTQANAAIVAKSEFLARMSHEVKTPINGVLGMAEVLRNTDLSVDQISVVNSLRVSGKQLLNLVNELLDVSTLDSGSYELIQTDFDIRNMLREVESSYQKNAQEVGLDLQLRIAPAVPSMIHGDERRLRQILTNLVGNAIKFSDHGDVILSASMEPGDGASSLCFYVEDHGIGIEPDKIKTVFDVFQQGDGSITRRYGGSGLGLSISKSFVELMGGTIAVESAVGVGSKFSVEIPLQVAKQLPSQEADLPLLSLPAQVLVAEDNPINQTVIMAMLESFDCDVTVVDNGEEALEALAHTEYDILFMDCQMPVMDGLTATQIARERGDQIPIVAVTANSMKGDREICLAAGMNDYISKPVEAEKLRAMVLEWVAGGKRAVAA